MLNLAIECSGMQGSVALANVLEVIHSVTLEPSQSSVQSLSVTIAAVLRPLGGPPNLLSITSGPGSFTGLRVGLATAKMLGLAWKIPIVPVDTLEVLAFQMNQQVHHDQPTILVPVMNAYRQQVFTAAWYSESPDRILRISPSIVVDAEEWVTHPLACQPQAIASPEESRLSASSARDPSTRLVIAGPGLAKYRPVPNPSDSSIRLTLLESVEPQADAVALLGTQYFRNGFSTSAHQLTANYIRSSAAEEKLPK